MIKLTAENDWQHAAWYFRTAKEVKKFKDVFEDHGISIRWNTEEAEWFPEMDSDDLTDLYRKPKKRAEDELDWAFNSYLKDNHASDRSAAIADTIMRNIMNENKGGN